MLSEYRVSVHTFVFDENIRHFGGSGLNIMGVAVQADFRVLWGVFYAPRRYRHVETALVSPEKSFLVEKDFLTVFSLRKQLNSAFVSRRSVRFGGGQGSPRRASSVESVLLRAPLLARRPP